ncbi:MAG: stage III sporulation protein AA [Clostridium sp.]|uniref:stage III sporulation protein AA n=1 Tax=Clostridium sp. TaxID=1506 RepID=UPI00306A27CD
MITKDILDILPNTIKGEVINYEDNNSLQEIRLKINKPLIFISNNTEIKTKYITKHEDIKVIIQKISSYSIYAFEEEIKQGYITIQGGHRVGICGTCVLDGNSLKTIKHISSINIRVAREIRECSTKIIPFIVKDNRVLNTIIISPPKCGKTTILRDLSRQISNGVSGYGLSGKNVAIIDERSEIGACYRGVPQMDIGIRTDILDNCPKSEGIIMAIRSMAPHIIVCDEIGTYKDMDSIVAALNSGVNLITTIHGFSEEDLYKRPVFKEVLENKVFDRAIILSNRQGISTIEYIYDFTKGERVRGW